MGDGNWGTVCNFGWTIESAALACQQMGWVLNPEDWLLLPNEIPQVKILKNIMYKKNYLNSESRSGHISTVIFNIFRLEWIALY